MSALTYSLSGSFCRRTFSTQYIFLRGDGFEVVRIYAFGVTAQMVDSQSFGYWAFDNLVGNAMRPCSLAKPSQDRQP